MRVQRDRRFLRTLSLPLRSLREISFLEVDMKAAMEWVKVVAAAVAIVVVVWVVVSLAFALPDGFYR